MKNWNIRARIFILAILPVSIFATSSFFYLALSISSNHEKRLTEQAFNHAKKLAAIAENGVYLRNPDRLRAIAVATLDEKDIISANFFTINGKIIAGNDTTPYELNTSSLFEDRPSVIDDNNQRISVIAPVSIRRSSNNSNGTSAFKSVETLSSQNPSHSTTLIGWANIIVSKEISNARIRHEQATALKYASTLFLTIILLALLLARSIATPILKIQEAVHAINSGNPAMRLPVAGSSDMQRLAENFNIMADMLQSHRTVLEARISEATQVLEQRKNEAEQANLAKSRFLAAASHDLRQPLHALSLFISDLQIAPNSPAHQALLIDKIVTSVHQVSNLLDSLLDISKLDIANVTPTLSSVPLNDLLYRLQISFGRSASEHGLRLRVITGEHKIHTDNNLMERLLANLLANAIRYTFAGKILVTARRTSDPGTLRIEVRDSGIGISPEHQQAIFEEFFQIGNNARDTGRGLGLGLTIVKRIADILNLKIGLRSQPEKGSVFWVEVPKICVPEVKKLATPILGPLLLLLELDHDTQQIIEDTVCAWGYRTIKGTQSYLSNKKNEWPKTIIASPLSASAISNIERLSIPVIVVTQSDEEIETVEDYKYYLSLPIRPARLRALLPRFTV